MTDKVLTGFRLTKQTVKALNKLRDDINKVSVIKLSRAAVLELIIRQAIAEKITKKVNNI